MSHDIEAAYIAPEIVRHLLADPTACFATPPPAGSLSAYAAREGRHSWPHADGVIELSVAHRATPTDFSLALEFKRPNEGVHGVLTAIGQSHAYLRKGYSGSVIAIPSAYSVLADPGTYVREVLDLTSKAEGIGVFTYDLPDMSKVSPFQGKLKLLRRLRVDAVPPIASMPASRTETQWAHLREGSSEPDAFYKYLQSVKLLGGGGADPVVPKIPKEIADAVGRVRAGTDPERYLSYCPNNSLPDIAWRHFWFKYVLRNEALKGWTKDSSGVYHPNLTSSTILRADGRGPKLFFVGRSDSIKNRLAKKLNDGAISEADALEALVENYNARAHSYREDIDSGCEHLGFVDSDGRLTDAGYEFVDSCERYGNPNEGLPRALFLRAVLGEGALGAFLHYIYRLSEEKFGSDPLAFSSAPARSGDPPSFDQNGYLRWVEGEMENRLHVIRKVSARGGVARKPFQAELALLRTLGIVGSGFRIGVGLIVNWPELQDAMSFAEGSFVH